MEECAMYYFLFLSVVLLAAGIMTALKAELRFEWRIRIFAAGVLAADIAALFPVLMNLDQPETNAIVPLFIALQMGSLNTSFGELLKGASALGIVYQVYFSVLCILSPVVLGGVVVTMFQNAADSLKYLLNRRRSAVYLFSEINDHALLLAESIASHERKALIVFCGCSDNDSESVAEARASGCIFIAKPEFDIVLRSKKTRVYFEISEDENENLRRTKILLQKYTTAECPSDYQNIRVFLFSAQEETGLALDAANKQGIRVQIVDRNRLAANQLLFEHPLYTAVHGKKKISVLVVGAGHTGKEIVKDAVWCGQLGPDYHVDVTVIDKNAEHVEAVMRKDCPEIFAAPYSVSFIAADAETEQFESVLDARCGDADYIAVCLGNDGLNIKTALFLRAYYLRKDSCFTNEPFIAVLTSDDTNYQSVAEFAAIDREKQIKYGWTAVSEQSLNYRLCPFGSYSSIYSYDFLVDSLLEKLAINVHYAYDLAGDHDKTTEQESQIRYNVSEINRRSDRATALHIRYKLFMLGYDMKEMKNASAEEIAGSGRLLEQLKSQLKDSAVIDRMARVEHDRWCAFMRAEGWRSATLEQALVYKARTFGNQKFTKANMHACLCSWNELDRIMPVFCSNLKEYDARPFRDIPMILGLEESRENPGHAVCILTERKEK